MTLRDPIHASLAFRRFMSRLNRACLRNAYVRHGRRLKVVPVLEGGGATGKLLHYHAIIEVPSGYSSAEMELLVEGNWRVLNGPMTELHVEECRDLGWLDYMLKTRDKPEFLGAIDYCNLHI